MGGALADRETRILGRTLILHAGALPLWALRIAANPLESGQWIIVLIVIDALLAGWHLRANRLSDRAYRTWFGTPRSWTRLLYVPELVAFVFLIHDAFSAFPTGIQKWF